MKYWRSIKGEFFDCEKYNATEGRENSLPKDGYPYTQVYHTKREDSLGKLLDNEIYENEKLMKFYDSVIKELNVGKTPIFIESNYVLSEDGKYFKPILKEIEISEDVKNNFTKESLEMDIRMSKVYANWLLGPVSAYMNENAIKHIPIDVNRLKELANLIEFTDMVNFAIAGKQVLPEMIKTGERAWEVIHRLNLVQTSDESEIESIVKSVVDKYPDKVREYKNGKMNIASMFIGEVLRNSKEKKLNPKIVGEIIKKYLDGFNGKDN
jgi:Asp-tRNA(Asn)/Glu-tRNA(Gln) amidotransferase B subunit